ncbi:retrovirus-related pol polyprotein from transposon TNT 1-94 [Tanacetum coccineum]
MLTKPQFFYDHTTKQALGFQNPFYLKKAQQLEPKLYDCNVIKNTSAIVIPDSKETLVLAEESHFETRFVSQTELSAEQAFWSLNSVNSSDPTPSSRPTKVEVPKELPKVSMVNTSLKKLKHHLAGFDVVVKERTTTTTITEGSWGFEHTKACFRDEIIPFVKALKDLFNTFDQYLIDELSEVQNVFHQMEQAVKQHLNLKSVEISDLNASLQEKVLEITALKDDLRKLKGKALVDNAITKHTIDLEMLKIDVEPITPKLLNKRTSHSTYIKHTQEEVVVLRDLVDHVKANYPLDHSLESACRYTKLSQELLKNISKTCPSINNSGEQLVAMTPKNKNKRVRFTEPITSSGNTITKTASTSNLVSNKPMLSFTGVKPSTSPSDSQPSCNIKKDKIQQTPSSTQKNKVEAHPMKVKYSLKNKDCVVQPKRTAHVQHSKINANSELKCVKCNGCMLSDNHDLCVLDFINNVNAHNKSKSVKKSSKRKVWKPTGKVFTNIGYIWRPTGRTFTIVGNACPLTRITTTTEVPLRKPTALENETPTPVVTLVYSRKPRKSQTNVPVSKPKVIKSVSANKKEPSKSWGSIVYDVPSSSLDECKSSKLYDGILSYMSLVKGLKDKVLAMASTSVSSELCKKKPHKLKSEDTNQEKLYLLHMDLCGPMRVASVNGKKYILVIVDDYSRFTWVKCLRSKDEAPDFIIKFLKMIQVRLKTLLEYYEKVDVSYETSVARSPQQNGVVERRNHALIEASRTMLIYAKALLFLWAKAVDTVCYTQNRSIIRLRYDKTPYELLHDKLPDLLFFHVFGALCYPTNDSENLGKLQPKADIGISIGYAPTKKAFRIYNQRTKRIIETIHVDFDELTAMASEYNSSGPVLHEMTSAIISSGLVPNPPPSTPVDHPAPEVIAPVDEVVALEPDVSTGSPSSTTVVQDSPSPNVAHMNNDPFSGITILENDSEASSSSDVIPTVCQYC